MIIENFTQSTKYMDFEEIKFPYRGPKQEKYEFSKFKIFAY